MLPRHIAAIVVLARGDAELACWPLEGRGLDLAVVDEVARLHLAARRVGCSIRLRQACSELSALLTFVGLADVVTGASAGPLLQVVGQPEGGEEGGVEKVVMADDPVA